MTVSDASDHVNNMRWRSLASFLPEAMLQDSFEPLMHVWVCRVTMAVSGAVRLFQALLHVQVKLYVILWGICACYATMLFHERFLENV